MYMCVCVCVLACLLVCVHACVLACVHVCVCVCGCVGGCVGVTTSILTDPIHELFFFLSGHIKIIPIFYTLHISIYIYILLLNADSSNSVIIVTNHIDYIDIVVNHIVLQIILKSNDSLMVPTNINLSIIA